MSPEDMQRFEVGISWSDPERLELFHDCTPNWAVPLDGPLTLAELVERAGEHTEVCR